MTVDVEAKRLTKTYGNVVALDAFSHVFEKARIHALMGRNGSGKSTLVKMLAGVTRPDKGSLHLADRVVDFASPADALRQGVVTVHQELSLVPELTVAENIFLGRLPRRARFGVNCIDWREARRRAAALLDDMGLDISPDTVVSDLGLGRRQTVEIAKAMSFGPALLLLDEPTSALATKEVDMLFALLRRLRKRGVTMIYITHRLSELAEIADACTVLRDGKCVGSVDMADVSSGDIVDMMFGDVAQNRPAARARLVDRSGGRDRDRPILEVKGLSRKPAFEDVSFALHRGEVLGVAGLLGAGRTELLRAIFGADPHSAGEIIVDGARIDRPTPRAMSALGLGYTPENRGELGLVLTHSIHANLSLASLRRNARRGVVSEAAERRGVKRQITQLAIKVDDASDPVSSLSGGNQQKVVIGNWLNTEPKILFFDEPSRGVDLQAKRQIFRIIWEQAKRGVASIFVSTELEELLEVCDRVLVMKDGRLLGAVDPADTTVAELYAACMEGV